MIKRAWRAGLVRLAHRAIDAIADLPPLIWIRQNSYERQFRANRDSNLFRGIYSTFEAAAAAAPSTKPLGYDNAASAALYSSRFALLAHDYPALYWVASALTRNRNVLDLGGHIGIKYYAFSGVHPMPADLRWTVYDVPAVAAQGTEIAAARGAATQLRFTTSFPEAASMADILLASGSLQYLPQTLWEMLAPLERRPQRLVINTTPVHPLVSFFTLNSIGTAFCPYRVMKESELIDGLAAIGYRLRDRWTNPGKALKVPFHAPYDVADYSGYCFDRA